MTHPNSSRGNEPNERPQDHPSPTKQADRKSGITGIRAGFGITVRKCVDPPHDHADDDNDDPGYGTDRCM